MHSTTWENHPGTYRKCLRPLAVFLPSSGVHITEPPRQGGKEYVDVMVALFQERCTCARPGRSLIIVCISQALESDRRITVDASRRPELASRFCQTSRWVRTPEPTAEFAAGKDHM